MTTPSQYVTARNTAGSRYSAAVTELLAALVDLAALDATVGNAVVLMPVPQQVATAAGTTTSSPTLTFSSVPSKVVAGMTAFDVTSGQAIGTVQSTTSTTVTLTANAAHAVASGDTISFAESSPGVTPPVQTFGQTARNMWQDLPRILSHDQYVTVPPQRIGDAVQAAANSYINALT